LALLQPVGEVAEYLRDPDDLLRLAEDATAHRAGHDGDGEHVDEHTGGPGCHGTIVGPPPRAATPLSDLGLRARRLPAWTWSSGGPAPRTCARSGGSSTPTPRDAGCCRRRPWRCTRTSRSSGSPTPPAALSGAARCTCCGRTWPRYGPWRWTRSG